MRSATGSGHQRGRSHGFHQRKLLGPFLNGVPAEQRSSQRDPSMTADKWRAEMQYPHSEQLRKLHATMSPFPKDDDRCQFGMRYEGMVGMLTEVDVFMLSRLHSELTMLEEGAVVSRFDIPPECYNSIHTQMVPGGKWIGEYIRPRVDPLIEYYIHQYSTDHTRGLVQACTKTLRKLDSRPPSQGFL